MSESNVEKAEKEDSSSESGSDGGWDSESDMYSNKAAAKKKSKKAEEAQEAQDASNTNEDRRPSFFLTCRFALGTLFSRERSVSS
jgi:hypothetical protein